MMNNLKRFIAVLLVSFSVFSYAQDQYIVPFATGDADQEPEENPIDMHTSALLLAGVGLIASYAYFANRRKEKI